MTDYGEDFEDTHESMHMRRHERSFRGHKLSVAIGHNQQIRKQDGEKKARTPTTESTTDISKTGEIEQG